jgi:hypothetical protein
MQFPIFYVVILHRKKAHLAFSMISRTKVILFTLFYVSLGTVFVYFIYLKEWNNSIFKLAFNFGDVVENIVKYRKFEGKYMNGIDIPFRAHRLPGIPYFIAYLSIIIGTQKVFYVALCKNLIFALLWVPILNEGINQSKISHFLKIAFVAFILSFPQIFLHSLQIDLEESYVIPILAYYWILINQQKPFNKWQKGYFLILPSLLFFSKNTFLYIVPILSVIIILSDLKKLKLVLGSLVFLAISAYGLATFNLKNSGRFTLKYSLEWFNIYKGNNELTSKFYPKYSIDVLDYLDIYKIPESVKNEWEFNDFFKEKAQTYYKNNLDKIIEFLPTKILTIWLDVRPNSVIPGTEQSYFTPLKLLGVFYMVLFRIMQWFCLVYLFLQLFGKNRKHFAALSLKYISLIGLVFIPYTIAFGFERHLLPVIIPTVLTLIQIIETRNRLLVSK